MTPDLPPADVSDTFVFTDIVGSTPLVHALGDRYLALLADHNEILRITWREHNGIEVGTEGDSFFVAFVSATDAVRACVAAQRALLAHPWPDRIALHVRMGIHTGEATRVGADYLGIGVIVASRVSSAAHGDQVLISGASLGAATLDDDTTSRDLGIHGLKGIDAPVSLHQVIAPGLPEVFPPPATLRAARHNLPQPPGILRGRSAEVERAHRLLLGEARVVSIIGPGGIGKTRLALEIAHDLLAYSPGGVFLIEGAPLHDARALLPAIAEVLGLDPDADHPLVEQVAAAITAPTLFILDNLEHLEGCAEVIAGLVAASSSVEVLATSRHRLRIRSEQVLVLEPLAVPDADARSLDAVAGFPAALMFLDRARATDLARSWGDDDAPLVTQIVRRLDGVPLALELAGARLADMDLAAIADGLDRATQVLAEGDVDLPPRQRSMRAAIRWSVDLLAKPARDTLGAVSVFRGGAPRDALEAIVGRSVAEDLRTLAAASLVTVEDDRARILEPVRAAAEDLTPDRDRLRDAHLAWFDDLAARSWSHLAGHHQREWLARLVPDTANLDAAIDRAEVDRALAIAANLGRFWARSGRALEGSERLASALAGAPSDSTARAQALLAYGNLARRLGQTERARTVLAEATSLAADRDDHEIELLARIQLGEVERLEANESAAIGVLTIAAERARTFDAPGLAAQAEQNLALALAPRDLEGAIALLRGAQEQFEAVGDHHNAAQAAMNRATLLAGAGRPGEAATAIARLLDESHTLEDDQLLAHLLVNAGWIAFIQGNGDTAERATRDAVAMLEAVGDRHTLAGALANLSGILNDRGDRSGALSFAEEALGARDGAVNVVPMLTLSASFMALQHDEPARAMSILLSQPYDVERGPHAAQATIALAIAQARLGNLAGARASLALAKDRPGHELLDDTLLSPARESIGAADVDALWPR